jgi:pimeloyl-ACP methyl ester carboxylesterase
MMLAHERAGDPSHRSMQTRRKFPMTADRRPLFALCIAFVLGGCAGSDEPAVAASEAPLVPASVFDLIARADRLSPSQLGRVYTLDHYVRVGRGRRVHLTETFTLRSWLRLPHRAVLLLPGPLSLGSSYDLDVDGYRLAETLAKQGLFAFSVDYEGSGESTYPENGLDVTHDFLVDEGRELLDYVRLVRLVTKVDVLGESNGGAIASELCADSRRVRSCVMSSMLYAEGTPFYYAVFQDPGFLAFLAGQPDGYIDAIPDLYFNIVARSTPEVAAEILSTQPGLYAVGPLLEPANIPWYDPTRARVPALILQGTEDNIATQADAETLRDAYGSARGAGGDATLVRIAGGGHIPRLEPSPVNEMWTDEVVDFLVH